MVFSRDLNIDCQYVLTNIIYHLTERKTSKIKYIDTNFKKRPKFLGLKILHHSDHSHQSDHLTLYSKNNYA